MKHAAPKRQRCAVYTRKSTEHNLDLAFNSLDAQREACEAYVKSLAHEGWTLLRDRFDDGGLSGASLERPALQDLLNQVRAKQIDIIVVYKVDRLTRSLADFAKLVELFDAYDVSFVSVTQSFNTTSSMGRLTLNVLLSFAQFEREVIGERVRDKIAASKRKGLWVGGPVPLGYRSVAKKLEVVPEEADLVRKIFADYLKLGSIRALADKLNREGLKPKPRQLANGQSLQAACYQVGPLSHLLKNRFYLGEVVYKNEIHKGEHEPILDRELFDAVQERLKQQAMERSSKRRTSPSLLTGKLFDDRGNPMTPTHANKKGVRYRYYVSHAILQGRKADAGAAPRVSAPDVEKLIVDALRTRAPLETLSSDGDIVDRHLHRAIVGAVSIAVELRAGEEDSGPETDQPAISISFSSAGHCRKGLAHEPLAPARLDETSRAALLAAIARSRGWVDAILKDPSQSFKTIADREHLAERHIRFLAPLAFLSPKIVDAIFDGQAPVSLTVSGLARSLPMAWREQEAAIGLS